MNLPFGVGSQNSFFKIGHMKERGWGRGGVTDRGTDFWEGVQMSSAKNS